jgi:hypothetical protein
LLSLSTSLVITSTTDSSDSARVVSTSAPVSRPLARANAPRGPCGSACRPSTGPHAAEPGSRSLRRAAC